MLRGFWGAIAKLILARDREPICSDRGRHRPCDKYRKSSILASGDPSTRAYYPRLRNSCFYCGQPYCSRNAKAAVKPFRVRRCLEPATEIAHARLPCIQGSEPVLRPLWSAVVLIGQSVLMSQMHQISVVCAAWNTSKQPFYRMSLLL